MKDSNLEHELSKEVLFNIYAKKRKPIVRAKMNTYLEYLNRNGIDYNLGRFKYTNKEFDEYIYEKEKKD